LSARCCVYKFHTISSHDVFARLGLEKNIKYHCTLLKSDLYLCDHLLLHFINIFDIFFKKKKKIVLVILLVPLFTILMKLDPTFQNQMKQARPIMP
jgi:hypothetical protein